jgi:hypothetical protein
MGWLDSIIAIVANFVYSFGKKGHLLWSKTLPKLLRRKLKQDGKGLKTIFKTYTKHLHLGVDYAYLEGTRRQSLEKKKKGGENPPFWQLH